ncbi:MAG TPA: type VI secretion system tip protein TssI/VgrG, partial [Gemmataceae bacterium]|nr:type VI secretion system tip protein TssI/VgrG [Gemmataceae bacterium]
PRDYCVQYRETDFNFASRIMEEEGIYYFFKHSASGSQMVVANTPDSHPDLAPTNALVFKSPNLSAALDEEAIYRLSKTQEVTSGKFTLWDHHFELPHKHLEAEKPVTPSVQVGKVTHKLNVGDNGKLEIYDWPGEYAQRFDGIAPGGGDRAADLQKIFTDNKRTVDLRMQAAAAGAVTLNGTSNLRHLTPGFKVTISATDDLCKPLGADGPFVLTTVHHTAAMGADYRSGYDGSGFRYENTFTLLPLAAPFRPQRTTPKPVVAGTQTAVVVGPKGEEIFTDRHGRVKVQFHWDREGKNDANSSCWVRVSQPWAGKRWGAFFIPRIGQEIIVDFLEGDPDQPIGVGCVYNPDQPHPYLGDGPDTGNRSNHKQDPKLCGVKSNTTPGGVGFNEWRFDDTKGKEQVFIHAERDMDMRVKNDRRELVIHDTHLIVGAEKDGKKAGDQKEKVYQDKHLHVLRDQQEKVEGNVFLTVGKGQAQDGGRLQIVIEKDKYELIGGQDQLHVKKAQFVAVDDEQHVIVTKDKLELLKANNHLHVNGNRNEKVDGSQSLTVGGDQKEKITGGMSLNVGGKQDVKIGQGYAVEAGTTVYIKAGAAMVLEAGAQLSLKVGGNFIDISPAGVAIQGTMVMINSGGAAGSGTAPSPATPDPPDDATAPEDATEAQPVDPAVADNALSGQKSCPS